MSAFDASLTSSIAALSDDDLRRELQRTQQAVMLLVRTRRELGLRLLACLQRELDRRALYDRVAWPTTLGKEPQVIQRVARTVPG